MAKCVFIHNHDSKYDDVPWKQYQFPKRYLGVANKCIGDWVVYLEPRRAPKARGYFALAKVQEVKADREGKFLAIIESGSYLDFGKPVPFRLGGEYAEQGLLNDQGVLSGRKQSAIRLLSPEDFNRIVEYGLAGEESKPFGDNTSFFRDTPLKRDIQWTSRPVRNRNFRGAVLRAYSDSCAVSGLRLINGGGLAEVEAAHIRPVKDGGPDVVCNGIALSQTVHWLFDRGLIGLDDDLNILISRQTNDPEQVRSMINPGGTLLPPQRCSDRPRQEFVEWHRNNCFKQ